MGRTPHELELQYQVQRTHQAAVAEHPLLAVARLVLDPLGPQQLDDRAVRFAPVLRARLELALWPRRVLTAFSRLRSMTAST
ncbi:hypothetical protein [Deinococcus alpinitundrae]|uniref:hypothetical protein n=1 Tax=Deinococcus alpinitundrae TaxID=468913 RepID=UPI001ED8C304|nr:hypothetical protein [Deinococcus alpinitundrae]